MVTFPSLSTLATPPAVVIRTLPSAKPTPPSEPLNPYLTTSIFVPAATTPGIFGVTLSVAGGGWVCPPRPWANAVTHQRAQNIRRKVPFDLIDIPSLVS